MIKADLHTHTTMSDGMLSPKELVAEAAQIGLEVLAVTDHDTMKGVPEALSAGAQLGIRVIPGVELSAEHEPEIHIVGFLCDPEHPKLKKLLDAAVSARASRDKLMVERLRAAGSAIRLEDIQAEAGDGIAGRPHFARALIKLGEAETITEAFDKYLMPGKPGYVSRVRPSASCCINSVKAAGGYAVLAHPRLLNMAPFELEQLVAALARAGLSGIEAFSPGNHPADNARFLRMAKQNHLFTTGGSDFHAEGRPHCGLGGVPPYSQELPPPFL